MKKVLLLLLMIAFLMLSCIPSRSEVPSKSFTIEVTYIDGVKEVLNWNLPSESKFYIDSDRGSYTLEYLTDDQCRGCFGSLKAGVIRYKLIKVE